MRHAIAPLALAFAVTRAVGCAPPAERAAPRPPVVDVRPVPASGSGAAVAAAAAPPSCTIEGAGEPEDRLFFHAEEDLVLFAARADAEPAIRIEGRGRYTLHGRWTELAAADGDGRARLVLEQPGAFRLAGFSLLRATRFRLRRRTVLVPDHVWLEPDYLVQVGGAVGARVEAVAQLPFDAPRERALDIPCADLAYDDQRERVRDLDTKDARAHVDRLALHDRPGGPLAFEAGQQLFFVVIDEARDGFLRIHGERHGVRIAGWTPAALVSQDPQGSGDPGGSRSRRASKAKGKAARVTRPTTLYAERGGTEVAIGQLEPGAEVRVLRSGTGGRVAVELAGPEVRAVAGVTLQVADADVEPL